MRENPLARPVPPRSIGTLYRRRERQSWPIDRDFRILSLDGGGIRGILPLAVMAGLEKSYLEGRSIGQYFDLIAGTSTGGILAALYMTPGDDGRPKYSATDALGLYLDHGHEIFDRTLRQRILSLGGAIKEKFNDHNLTALLKQYFGDSKLSDFVKPSLITSYDITSRNAVFFTSVDARRHEGSNFYARDVARATSAAPTYFAPAHIRATTNQQYVLIDGGVFANNPALCAYAEALKIDFAAELPGCGKTKPVDAKEMFLVSLGTGSVKRSYHFEDFEHAGDLKWLEPVIDILMSGNSETVNYQLKSLYGTLSEEDSKDYHRLEPTLLEASSEMDLATPENIIHLKDAGLKFVDDNINLLDKIAASVAGNC